MKIGKEMEEKVYRYVTGEKQAERTGGNGAALKREKMEVEEEQGAGGREK